MQERKVYISLARVLCAFAVVVIHTNDCFYEFNIKECWIWANVIEGSLSFAVPVFFMISGATLIDYSQRYTTKEFFKKRLAKVLIPYIGWSIIACFLNVNVFLVFFFFLNLIGVYLCIPLFSYIKEEYKDRIIGYVIAVSFIFNYLIPFYYRITEKAYDYKIAVDLAGGYLIYALIGYLINKKDISLKWRLLSYMISIIGFALQIGGTYVVSMKNLMLNGNFKGYTVLPTLLSSVGVFILLKQIGQMIKNKKAISVIEWLSNYSFSVYLIHYFIIELIMEVAFVEDLHRLRYKLLTPIITFTMSIAIAWVIRKIPVIRKLLP